MASIALEDPALHEIVLVNERGRQIGTGSKAPVHRTAALHRAFSIFLVDQQGRLLLQRRNPLKYHSGGLWANSCCGHPRPGQRVLGEAKRRLSEELGVQARLKFAFHARYRCEVSNSMYENEFVHVYFGAFRGALRMNPNEVQDIAFTDLQGLLSASACEPKFYAPWLIHYLRHHRDQIEYAVARTIEAAALGSEFTQPREP